MPVTRTTVANRRPARRRTSAAITAPGTASANTIAAERGSPARTAAAMIAIATIVRDGCTPAPTRNPSATHPRIVSSAMYRMLSQWMNPETKVIALPAENGVMGRSPSVTATIATVAVEIDGDGVVHRARHAVTLRVLPKRRKRKRRARLREERGWIHGIAGVHDVSRVPVTGHHDPRHGEGGHDPRGGAATCPQDHHEQDDDRGWHRVRLDTDGEPRERRRVPGVDRDHARTLVHAPGNRERQCAEERSRQREISVGEARRHHVGALRRREEHDGNGPGEGATAETCC